MENPVESAEILIDNPTEWIRDALKAAIATDKTVGSTYPSRSLSYGSISWSFLTRMGASTSGGDLYDRDHDVLDALNAPFYPELTNRLNLPSAKKPGARNSASAQSVEARIPQLPDNYRASRARTGELNGQQIACHQV